MPDELVLMRADYNALHAARSPAAVTRSSRRPSVIV
jgi:hypothetical protein